MRLCVPDTSDNNEEVANLVDSFDTPPAVINVSQTAQRECGTGATVLTNSVHAAKSGNSVTHMDVSSESESSPSDDNAQDNNVRIDSEWAPNYRYRLVEVCVFSVLFIQTKYELRIICGFFRMELPVNI